ncbi:MAG: beta-ketoacyl-[acyl-carrier-protein] synthase II [Candidatus Marinimicrobia bacterium]|nr:beta-ketoacyl-[acyl-carrier-protein] synthase II [Candidatus Neomarinimicrobiota bacterium]|tara:strand:+ start:12923 stop:14152 length:1230 start_codon:yes stop_codon:yes gene_type:complete
MFQRVVVTGLGTVNPISEDVEGFWENLISYKNGINTISHFDTTHYKTKIAAEVNLDLSTFFNKKELNKIDRFTSFALIAADQAINDANINDKLDKNRIGVILGSGIGGINTLERQHLRLLKSPKRVSPYFVPSMISDIAPGHISIKYGFKGTNFSVVSACASSNHAIGMAFKSIKYNESDIIVTGGSEAGITPLSIAGFMNMKALSTESDINNASIPFDLNRNGFVMGEGSGILILESLESALKRNAKIYAEITGYGSSADAYHLTSPAPNGEGAKRAMSMALNEANIKPDDIDYINAHGTSTYYNDLHETQAIKSLFKKHAYNLSISSTKSNIGHLLGASGAVEAIATIKSINNSFITPTINYKTKDPQCDLDYTPNKGKEKNIQHAISNNFGFGGHNASILISKFVK